VGGGEKQVKAKDVKGSRRSEKLRNESKNARWDRGRYKTIYPAGYSKFVPPEEKAAAERCNVKKSPRVEGHHKHAWRNEPNTEPGKTMTSERHEGWKMGGMGEDGRKGVGHDPWRRR